MAVTSSSRGPNRPASTLAFIVAIVALALAIAYAANKNEVIPVGPQPTPSISAS